MAEGPRATDRFAAVTAAFMAGLAGSTHAAEVAAHFLAALASRMETAVQVRHALPTSGAVPHTLQDCLCCGHVAQVPKPWPQQDCRAQGGAGVQLLWLDSVIIQQCYGVVGFCTY